MTDWVLVCIWHGAAVVLQISHSVGLQAVCLYSCFSSCPGLATECLHVDHILACMCNLRSFSARLQPLAQSAAACSTALLVEGRLRRGLLPLTALALMMAPARSVLGLSTLRQAQLHQVKQPSSGETAVALQPAVSLATAQTRAEVVAQEE